ncbi:MAG TPA: hypothetical protein VMU13_03425 [Candidatus Paceibacterota bacterium]|nr:hypothetical protein [Candidatus Paceibacterota bacterium]
MKTSPHNQSKQQARLTGRQAGFTLLLAALIAAIVLSFATAIFDIAQKQVTLASLSQQSQYAFYAADTGSECALYWDFRYGYFSSTTPFITPKCDTSALSVSYIDGAGNAISASNIPAYNDYSASFHITLQSGYCVKVSVHKCAGAITDYGQCCVGNGVTNGSCDATKLFTTESTQIRADGYNSPCTSTASLATLQRSVELKY